MLRAVLLDQYPQIRPDSVELRGAIIDGDLKLTGDLRPSVHLHYCRISNARFGGATFTGPARFGGLLAKDCSFRQANFHGRDLGLLAGERVVFDEVVFHARVRVTVLANDVAWRHAELRAGGQLRIRSDSVDLTGTEFLRGSILADPGRNAAPPSRPEPDPKPADFDRLPLREQADYEARQASHQLAKEFKPSEVAGVTSLRQANVAELVLSAVRLDRCEFAGAHGLDKLRIDASCALLHSPGGRWRRRPPWFTGRRCVAEEAAWRRRYAAWAEKSQGAGGEVGELPRAMEIAGIYRDLRKGLEDIKNEPGAADFYYGEVEMRRLAAWERNRPTRGGAERGRGGAGLARPDRAERFLLHAYWALSGYGLRAARAFLALIALLLSATLVFATVGIASSPQPDPRPRTVNLGTGEITYHRGPAPDHSVLAAAEFVARDSVALLRSPASAPPLTGIGKLTDVVLRLLTPLLLALGLLAVRGRTKR